MMMHTFVRHLAFISYSSSRYHMFHLNTAFSPLTSTSSRVRDERMARLFYILIYFFSFPSPCSPRPRETTSGCPFLRRQT
jgi:hypothetical protein